jgi:DNA helicase-2/ATP-dependent DNA helicase PcrA
LDEGRSTIAYLSNLQPVDVNIETDNHFLSFIHDPFALTLMEGLINSGYLKYKMTPLQEKEMKSASRHCIYAFKDDYPWGTIIIGDEKKVVCKCTNKECFLFDECTRKYRSLTQLGEESIGINLYKNNAIVDEKQDEQFHELEIEGTEYVNCLKNGTLTEEVKHQEKSPAENTCSVESAGIFEQNNGQLQNITEEKHTNDKEKNESNSEFGLTSEPTSEPEDNNDVQGFDDFVEAEQNKVIKMPASERVVVNAGPGTGKTWTLIERVIYLLNEEKTDPQNILILCFSKAAVEVISTRLEKAFNEGKIGYEWYQIEIRTFDSFSTRLLAYVEEEQPELLDRGFQLEPLEYDQRISYAGKVIEKDRSLIEQCAHFIVDEVQDLVSCRAELVIKIIKALGDSSGYTLLGDACQSIYDYQVMDNGMTSSQFYKWLFNNQKNSRYYKFTRNYRQTTELENLEQQYRVAILSKKNDKMLNAIGNIEEKIPELSDDKLTDMDESELDSLMPEGTIAFLTRTNGLALKISTWLRNDGIKHSVKKRLTDNNFASWIGKFFCIYDKETINREGFLRKFESLGIANVGEAKDYWDGIENAQYKKDTWYKVSDLLMGIQYNAKSLVLFAADDYARVVVSNIHRAKGREYDNVVLIENDLDASHIDCIDEHKVYYVAITRAKSRLKKACTVKQYISTDKTGSGRSYQKSFSRSHKINKLSNIEIGRNYDIDKKSFAENQDIQDILIHGKELKGRRIKLVYNEKVGNDPRYLVYLEDEEKLGPIGKTSAQFGKDLVSIMKQTLNLHGNAQPQFYPDEFTDIYIEDIITIIDRYDPILVGAKRMDNIMIWMGITISGFASANFNRY